jgi:succinate-semialdehyde dehydrogenase/glutarate-semialdehyde dehydrogenase
LADQVERTIAAGARCLRGGKPDDGPGWFYPPTVLVDVAPGMPAFDEETFGPVAAVIRADGTDDAVAMANLSTFGLGASVYSRDAARALRDIVPHLRTGHVAVNGIVKSDPRLPFGGIRDSGFGRELGRAGIQAFVNAKTVWVR